MENNTLLKGVKIPEQGFIEVMITSAGEVVQTGKSVRYDGVDYYTSVGPELIGSAIPAVEAVTLERERWISDQARPKTYCEKWPSGCQMCDLLMCGGKRREDGM